MSARPLPASADTTLSDANVRDALRALRFAKPLDGSPLLGLVQIEARLRAEGVGDSTESRTWLLGEMLTERIKDGLARARGESDSATVDLEATAFLETMPEDFRDGEIDRESWSMLCLRHVVTDGTPNTELADHIGVTKRTLMRRLARGYVLAAQAVRHHEFEAKRAAAEAEPKADSAGEGERPHGIEGAAGASTESASSATRDPSAAQGAGARQRSADTPPAMATLRAAIAADPEGLALDPASLAALARFAPRSIEEQRLTRVAAASLPGRRVDANVVELTLLDDRGEAAGGNRWQPRSERIDDMRTLLDDSPFPVHVVLGPPGAGKSCVLHRLDQDLAIDGLAGTRDHVTFFVPLSGYTSSGDGELPPEPRAWLANAWRRRYPRLPELTTLLDQGRMVLLLDALNEMPHRGLADYRARVAQWKRFIQSSLAGTGNHAVFSCRSLDYSAPLSTPELRVPQVRVEPLSDARMRTFVQRHAPEQAERLWGELLSSPYRGLLRSPFFLRLLVDHFALDGRLPEGRAAMIAGLVRRAIQREVERDHPALAPGRALAPRDLQRIASARAWRTPWELPERGPLVPGLARMAFHMQVDYGFTGEDAVQLRVPFDEGLDLVGAEAAEHVIDAGLALGLLDEDRDRDELLFVHQLVQEFFAARQVVVDFDFARAAAPWRATDMEPPLEEELAALGPSEPLPPLPATGWEESLRMAAALSDDPETFVTELEGRNLALAGRCAAQPELRARLSEMLLARLRTKLVERSRDPQADPRTRVAAALALGELGDPRLPVREHEGHRYIEPSLVTIPAGEVVVGSDEPLAIYGQVMDAHVPARRLRIAPFAIGRTPVTNAEWAHFQADGGYEDERWWQGASAKAWRRGEGTSVGIHYQLSGFWRRCREEPAQLDERYADGTINRRNYEMWKRWAALSEEAFAEELLARYPHVQHRAPLYWDDPQLNQPALPVLGISWYEANAFCAWLSARCGRAFRLPTEYEWETAARGPKGRLYPYGNSYRPLQANLSDLHLFQISPAGVFPESDTPEGVADLMGNLLTWTASDPLAEEVKAQALGRNQAYDPSTHPTAGIRAVRGSSWNTNPAMALFALRHFEHPGNRSMVTGMRLASEEI